MMRQRIAYELDDTLEFSDHRRAVAHAVIVIAQAQFDALLTLLLGYVQAACQSRATWRASAKESAAGVPVPRPG